ncbi:hypothetical protein GA0116948_102321 [Chitinophaga costaii]|uniref:Uncharacterized protein n=1 Tax=Chitinophaga costaii TaxID=1335309 RepID=A0A1C4AX42_9BACT|nr:hypothetical protein [Chitinophaga costaii]PUZ26779.1 hypothetical protein DCM91_10300 [Chitinophaga costaii]SCB99068.1 hypothetical protein GA0116948_102321 [Chitinophaga costaii]
MKTQELSLAEMQDINGGGLLSSLGANLLLNLTGSLNTSNPASSNLGLTGILTLLGIGVGLSAAVSKGGLGLNLVLSTPSL